MTNYRISKIDHFTGSMSAPTKVGRWSTSSLYTTAWGVMVPSGSIATAGSLQFEGGGRIDLGQLLPGQIYPCYPAAITVTAGTASLLS